MRILSARAAFAAIITRGPYTLLRVGGALFCHDAKRASTRTDKIELNRGVTEKKILIRPDPRLGQPGPLAHKIFVALLKKHSNYGRPVQSDISFSKRELMRLIGRSQWGGRVPMTCMCSQHVRSSSRTGRSALSLPRTTYRSANGADGCGGF